MPIDLDDSAATWDDVAVPLGAEPRTAASVEAGFQALANRTKFLRNRTDTTGVLAVRRVATTAALKALQANAWQVALLEGSAPGLYVFVEEVHPADIPNFIYRFDDPSDGAWVNLLWLLGADSGGTVKLDTNVLTVANRIVATQEASDSGTTNATEAGGVFGPSITFNNLEVGDVVRVEAHVRYSINGSTGGGEVGIAINGTIAGITKRFWSNSHPDKSALQMFHQVPIGVAGNYTFQMMQTSLGSITGSPLLEGPRQIRGMVIRP